MITLATLDRFLFHVLGTCGILRVVGTKFECYTLELPWVENKRNVSCIPAGLYVIKRDTFKGRYENFKLLNVRDRDAIEMHRANKITQLLGCIALGNELAFSTERSIFLNQSQRALDAFMETMSDSDEAALHIRENVTTSYKY